MYLFKASGVTYRRVVRQQLHAFPSLPTQAHEGEFILLSKNRADCGMLEKQVQYVAKLHSIRSASSAELERLFPEVSSSNRWRYFILLYFVRQLEQPFNLCEAPGLDFKRYATVQCHARIAPADETAILHYLIRTNSNVVLDFVNNTDKSDSLWAAA